MYIVIMSLIVIIIVKKISKLFQNLSFFMRGFLKKLIIIKIDNFVK
jgi:hypothetical protein